MSEQDSQIGDVTPFHVRKRTSGFIRKKVGGFANDFKQSFDGSLGYGAGQISVMTIGNYRGHFVRGVDDVEKA